MRRLARAGHAGHDRQPPLGNVDLQRLDRMDLRRWTGESFPAQTGPLSRRAGAMAPPAAPDRNGPICEAGSAASCGHRALCNDAAALCAGLRPHLNDPVGFVQDLRVVIDENDGIAVRHQVVHHSGEAHDVGRVQADGRLIQHIEHAGRAVAHGAGQLHPLPLAGGERRRGAVERQVAEPQVQQPPRRARKSLADALRHGAHLLRQAVRHALPPSPHSSESVIVHASSSEMPRSFGARAAADRRVPPQSGHTSSFRNFSTRFMPFSSLTLARAFSTV